MDNNQNIKKELLNFLDIEVKEKTKQIINKLRIVDVSLQNLPSQIDTLKRVPSEQSSAYSDLLNNTKKRYNNALKVYNEARSLLTVIVENLKKAKSAAEKNEFVDVLSLIKSQYESINQCTQVLDGMLEIITHVKNNMQ